VAVAAAAAAAHVCDGGLRHKKDESLQLKDGSKTQMGPCQNGHKPLHLSRSVLNTVFSLVVAVL